VASDLNLNFLNMNSDYAADRRPAAATVLVTYNGLAKYTDIVGMDWRYWPCANNGTGACASQCRATGAASPCQMRPQFTSFGCGLTETMTITGGTAVESAEARWIVDVPWERYGTSATATRYTIVPGTAN
jgi:hypothetical protein